MLNLALAVAFAAVGLSFALAAWRLFRGPDAVDRALAFDTLYVNAVALLMVVPVASGSRLYVEGALLIALMGFVGTAALARHIERGSVTD